MITPYYDHAGIVLYNADCLDVMPQLSAASVNLVLADLPYGTTACAWDSIIPLDALWREYKRLITPNGALVFTASQPFTSALVMSNPAWYRCEWIWEKPQGTCPMIADRQPLRAHESILVFYQQQPTYNPQMGTGRPYNAFLTDVPSVHGESYQGRASWHRGNEGTRYPKTVLRFPQERQTLHPNQKSIKLMEYLIRTYTNPGDLVLDNTMGSGTTPRAAKNLGRRCIGIEKDTTEGYCRIAADRLAQEVLPLSVA